MKIKSISELKNLKNKKVLLRLGLDSVVINGKLADKFRLDAVLPTLDYLIKHGAAVIIITHLGRPGGKKPVGSVNEFSTKPLANIISKAIAKPVEYINGVIEQEVKDKISTLKAGQIILLENLRFYPGEEKNDSAFAKKLASGADLYVNEAFSVCHRVNASIAAITKYLRSFAGFSLVKEVESLTKALTSKDKPKIAVIGGAKLETKVAVVANLQKKFQLILTGGMIANSFLAAGGHAIGSSKMDAASVKIAKKLLSDKVLTPNDAIVAKKNFSSVKAIKISEVKKDDLILDIGQETINIYSRILSQAKVIIFNGPMGYFEDKKFRNGSECILRAIMSSSAFKVIGGGETLQLIADYKKLPANCFVSTGGGAMLEFLAGKVLPGIKPLIK